MSGFASKDTAARKRLAALFDDGVFTEIDAFAKSSSGDVEAVAGFGVIGGAPAYAFSQDVSANGGAVSVAQCAKLKKIYDLAAKTGCPVIGVYDSNGMDLKEGFEGLNAYGELVKASSRVSGVVPQISVIAGSALGTTALIAGMADVVIALRDCDYYISAPSDETAQSCAQSGSVDIVADDFDTAAASVRALVTMIPSNNLSEAPVFDFSDPSFAPETGDGAAKLIAACADEGSVIELKADYAAENCVTALATVAGSAVGFVAFGGKKLCPACAYKAEGFVKLCDAFSIPVVTLLDSSGVCSEKENQMLIAAEKLTCAYAGATCPKVTVITGNAVGAAYLMLAGRGSNADLVYAWDTAVVSPLETDAAVAFLFNDRLAAGEDRNALEKEYNETLASPFTAAACGAVDDIFVPAETRSKLIAALDVLSGKRETTIPRKHSVK